MRSTTSVLRHAGLITALAATALPAAAHASPAVSATSQASASVALQAHAQLSTARAERLAATAGTKARSALRQSQVQLRQAAELAADVAATAQTNLAAETAGHFSATVDGDVHVLANIAESTSGRLALAAAQAIRQDVQLAATVNAAVAARTDVGTDASLAASVAEADRNSVDLMGRLSTSLGQLAGRARTAMAQAMSVEMTVRAAIIAHIQSVFGQAASTAEHGLSNAIDALTHNSASISQSLAASPTVSVSGHADANASTSAGSVADIVASLDAHLGGKATSAAQLRSGTTSR